MELLQAQWFAYMVYALTFVVFFRQRLIYLIVCAVVAIAITPPFLEYVPPVWIFFDILISAVRYLRGGRR